MSWTVPIKILLEVEIRELVVLREGVSGLKNWTRERWEVDKKMEKQLSSPLLTI